MDELPTKNSIGHARLARDARNRRETRLSSRHWPRPTSARNDWLMNLIMQSRSISPARFGQLYLADVSRGRRWLFKSRVPAALPADDQARRSANFPSGQTWLRRFSVDFQRIFRLEISGNFNISCNSNGLPYKIDHADNKHESRVKETNIPRDRNCLFVEIIQLQKTRRLYEQIGVF